MRSFPGARSVTGFPMVEPCGNWAEATVDIARSASLPCAIFKGVVMSVCTLNGAIVYRASRLRFIIVALFVLPFTVLIAWWAYDGVLRGDTNVRESWVLVPLCAFYIWFDYVLVAKLVCPPELTISPTGIRWSNYAMLQWPANYEWTDLEGPDRTNDAHGGALLQFVVKATGRKLKLPPNHFGASYDEMAAVILAARNGQLISPEQWRTQHSPDQPGAIAETRRLYMWLAIGGIAILFLQDLLYWALERGGIFSIISALISIRAHSTVLNIDESGLRFPIIVMLCATVYAIVRLFKIRVERLAKWNTVDHDFYHRWWRLFD